MNLEKDQDLVPELRRLMQSEGVPAQEAFSLLSECIKPPPHPVSLKERGAIHLADAGLHMRVADALRATGAANLRELCDALDAEVGGE
jgi:hypothetical protein